MCMNTGRQDIIRDSQLDPRPGTRTPEIRTSDCVVDPILWNSVFAFEIDDTLKRREDLDISFRKRKVLEIRCQF